MSEPWPDDLHDAIFLARAADRIGRAMFSHEWSGNEMSAFIAAEPQPLADDPPPRSIVSLLTAGPTRSRDPAPKICDLEDQRAAVASWNLAARQLLPRRDAVVTEIVRAAEAGLLAISYLDDRSGLLAVTPREWWRGNFPRQRFRTWSIDWKHPLVPSRYVEKEALLFADRTGLEALLERIPRPSPTPLPWHPKPRQLMKNWCVSPAAEEEMNRRLTGESNVTAKMKAETLAKMSDEASPGQGWPWKSIETTRAGRSF